MWLAFVRPFETWHTDIIFDFKYRSNETLYDSKIEDDPVRLYKKKVTW